MTDRRAVWESKTIMVAGNRKTVGNHVVQQSGIQCFNCKRFGHFAKECIKQKRVRDYEYHKEKMMLSKQESKGITLSSEQDEWLQDTNEGSDEQEPEANYMYIEKIHETDRNVISDSSNMCDDEVKVDQNVDEPEDKLVMFASLIGKLKLDDDENKNETQAIKESKHVSLSRV
ncbi:putative ribonuclease H-like domain-containing protein [Tanacetum coccineum]|uniref:Ribonuclease H-like domain-containing protein n=1 Tax=Tanacetum coccineum TaxID=301880 RepID=A0ABQ4XE05_9ASTR